jgi:hypothetical protein
MPGIADQIAESFVTQLARGGLDGIGPLAPAHDVAEDALAAHGDREAAIDAVVSDHTRLAAVSGFVTSLGGFIVLAPFCLLLHFFFFLFLGSTYVRSSFQVMS